MNEGGGTVCFDASGINKDGFYTVADNNGTYSGVGSGWQNSIAAGRGEKNSPFGTGVFTPQVFGGIYNAQANVGNICDNMPTFTVSLWLTNQAGAGPTFGCLVGKMGSGGFSTGQGWGAAIQWDVNSIKTNQPYVITQTSGGSAWASYNAENPIANGWPLAAANSQYISGWHHVVYVVTSYVPTAIYIDGVKQVITNTGQGTVPVTTTNINPLILGTDFASATQDSSGMPLCGVGVWNRALTQDEVQELYADPFCLWNVGKTFASKAGLIKIPAASLTLHPTGIVSGESLGGPSLSQNMSPLGIVSQEMLGAALTGTTQILTPDGIPGGGAHGAQGVAETLNMAGLQSTEALGNNNVATNNASNLLPGGIPSGETPGATLVELGTNLPDTGGIGSGETFGGGNTGITINPLGVPTAESLGGLRAALNQTKRFAIPGRRQPKYQKPPTGTGINYNHDIAQGLVAAFPFNENAGQPRDLVTGKPTLFGTHPTVNGGVLNPGNIITWAPGIFGSAPYSVGGTFGGPPPPTGGNYNYGGVLEWLKPQIQWDLNDSPTGMSVSFWMYLQWSQGYLPNQQLGYENGGVSIQGSVPQNYNATLVCGWVMNVDNWTPTGGPGTDTSWYLKLEMEYFDDNKQGGIKILGPSGYSLLNQWHHYVLCTAQGTNAPTTDDYTLYLDGELIPSGDSRRIFYPGTGTEADVGVPLGSDALRYASLYSFAGLGPDGGGSLQSSGMAGQLDNVLWHNRVLTPAEVQLLYTDPFCYMQKPKPRLISGSTGGPSLFITPLGIVSQEKLGALQATLTNAFNITPGGIPSQAALGATQVLNTQQLFPLGIVTQENFGAVQAALANVQFLEPGGIFTLEGFGSESIIAVGQVTTPPGRTLQPQPVYRVINVQFNNT